MISPSPIAARVFLMIGLEFLDQRWDQPPYRYTVNHRFFSLLSHEESPADDLSARSENDNCQVRMEDSLCNLCLSFDLAHQTDTASIRFFTTMEGGDRPTGETLTVAATLALADAEAILRLLLLNFPPRSITLV